MMKMEGLDNGDCGDSGRDGFCGCGGGGEVCNSNKAGYTA